MIKYLANVIFLVGIQTSIYCQTIDSNLIVQFENIEIEVLKTPINKILNEFRNDSIVEIENEGSYIFINNQLEFFVCDKNFDNLVDLVVLYSKKFITWNGIQIGLDFQTVASKIPQGKIGVNQDFANSIYYSFKPDGLNYNLDLYFDIGKIEAIPDLPEDTLREMLLKKSKLTIIEINNPND